jgi:glycosyltransferase involved in cell wall biosynthesis
MGRIFAPLWDEVVLKISYVVTVYNKGHLLAPVLASLEGQIGDFSREFIFVDDGSTDNGPELIRSMTASWDNVRLLRRVNGGPALATNTGLQAATGDFIKLVDADDVLAPWASALLLDLALKSRCDAIYGCGRYFRDGEAVVFPDAPAATASLLDDPLHYAIRRGLAGASHLLVRREAVLAAGGCDEGVFAQDYSLALRLAERSGRIGLTDAVVWQGPEDDPKRLMKNRAQHEHDYNFALSRFVTQYPIAPAYRHLAAKRATGRAWNWAKRHFGMAKAMPWLWLNLRARGGADSDALFEAACQPFRRSTAIRIPAQQ